MAVYNSEADRIAKLRENAKTAYDMAIKAQDASYQTALRENQFDRDKNISAEYANSMKRQQGNNEILAAKGLASNLYSEPLTGSSSSGRLIEQMQKSTNQAGYREAATRAAADYTNTYNTNKANLYGQYMDNQNQADVAEISYANQMRQEAAANAAAAAAAAETRQQNSLSLWQQGLWNNQIAADVKAATGYTTPYSEFSARQAQKESALSYAAALGLTPSAQTYFANTYGDSKGQSIDQIKQGIGLAAANKQITYADAKKMSNYYNSLDYAASAGKVNPLVLKGQQDNAKAASLTAQNNANRKAQVDAQAQTYTPSAYKASKANNDGSTYSAYIIKGTPSGSKYSGIWDKNGLDTALKEAKTDYERAVILADFDDALSKKNKALELSDADWKSLVDKYNLAVYFQ